MAITFPLTQDQANAINGINQAFQNYQIGEILKYLSEGTLPAGSIGTADIDLLAITGPLLALLAVNTAQLANGAATNDKLAADVKVGSLATLTTTEKASVVGALNEVNALAVAAIPSNAAVDVVRTGQVTLNAVNPTRVSFQADTAAFDTGSATEPFDLTGVGSGGTVIINPDGAGNKTSTLTFTAASSVSGASPSLDISAGVDQNFMIQVRGDTAELVTLTLAGLNSGAAIAADMQTKIRALGGNKALLTVDHNSTVAAKYAIVDTVFGTSSTVVITAATTKNITEELKIGVADGGAETAGTGDFANAAAATAAEFAAILSSDMAGLTVTVSGGALIFTSDTTGVASSLVHGNGTLNAVVGITNAEGFYGSQGLGFATDMADANFIVTITPVDVVGASLADIALGVSGKLASEFSIQCETTSSAIVVDVVIFGLAA